MGRLYFLFKEFLDPLLLFFLLAGLLFWKGRGRTLLLSLPLLTLYLLSIRPTTTVLTSVLERGCPVEISQGPLEAVVVLGAGAASGEPSPETASRLIKGLEVFLSSHSRYLVLSGGNALSKEGLEAEVMGKIAKRLGIPEEKLIIEGMSYNTHQHPIELRKMDRLDPNGRIALVTSAIHMRRASMDFKPYFQDLVLVPVGCSQKSFSLSPQALLPSINLLYYSNRSIHEIFGLVKDRLLLREGALSYAHG